VEEMIERAEEMWREQHVDEMEEPPKPLIRLRASI
jgi:hypothetical protein